MGPTASTMCGIIGIFTGTVTTNELVEGLSQLEYRGYDSWGVGLLTTEDFWIEKHTGRISHASLPQKTGIAGIGHTRWATHGRVSKENAHPHQSRLGGLIGVHNGIIEQYHALEEILKKEGVYEWVSETDTERALTFLDSLLRTYPLKDALHAFAQEVQGSFAILALTRKHALILVRGSPLLLGRGERGILAASDVTAFPSWVRHVFPLPDETAGIISLRTGEADVFSLTTSMPRRITWQKRPEAGMRPPLTHEHYTIQEILEQPARLREAWQYWQQDPHVIRAQQLLKNEEELLLLASGSSLHAGMVFQRWQAQQGRRVILFDAADTLPQKPFFKRGRVLLAISQSGETADVLDAVRKAKAAGMRIIALVNRPFSTLSRLAEIRLPLHAGVEVSVVATKSYTAQLLLLARLLSIPLPQDFFSLLDETLHQSRKPVHELAMRMQDAQDIFLIARGPDTPTAFEGALKIKEISYQHAEAFHSGTLKHGSLALIHPGTWTFGISTDQAEHERLLANLEEVRARGGRIVLVSPWEAPADAWIRLPDVSILGPLIGILPLQLLAYELAILRGNDPDRPRNLAKSVTVS